MISNMPQEARKTLSSISHMYAQTDTSEPSERKPSTKRIPRYWAISVAPEKSMIRSLLPCSRSYLASIRAAFAYQPVRPSTYPSWNRSPSLSSSGSLAPAKKRERAYLLFRDSQSKEMGMKLFLLFHHSGSDGSHILSRIASLAAPVTKPVASVAGKYAEELQIWCVPGGDQPQVMLLAHPAATVCIIACSTLSNAIIVTGPLVVGRGLRVGAAAQSWPRAEVGSRVVVVVVGSLAWAWAMLRTLLFQLAMHVWIDVGQLVFGSEVPAPFMVPSLLQTWQVSSM
mmetsp:Transcript_14063/g.33468  ORF Transcript_14063/g.33468 Transcript_14063/m.33468 type:complete len:284 (+) Transcript_14063:2515-3366(+)